MKRQVKDQNFYGGFKGVSRQHFLKVATYANNDNQRLLTFTKIF